MTRAFSSALLGAFMCLVLILTGQSMVVARGASVATGQMVICTSNGLSTVYVDAQGEPTSAPHICPDCMLAFSDAPPRGKIPEPTKIMGAPAVVLQPDATRALFVETGFLSRAPPMPV